MDTDLAYRTRIHDKGAHRLLAAGALIVAAVIGVGLLPDGGGGTPPRPAVPSSTESSLPSGPTSAEPLQLSASLPNAPDGELSTARHEAAVAGIAFSFAIQAPGWSIRTEFGGLQLWRSEGGAGLIIHAPNRVYADPCRGVLAPPVGPSAAELAEAVATIPGAAATGPFDMTMGGYPAKHVLLVVRADADCAAGPFFLWRAALGPARHTKGGHTIRVWIVDVAGTRLFVEAETPPGTTLELDQEIGLLVDSFVFGLPPRPTALPPLDRWALPPPGELAPGWYTANVDAGPPFSFSPSGGYPFGFRLVTSGWTSSGPDRDGLGGYLTKESPPSRDAAVIRFSSPGAVSINPCVHTLRPPIGSDTVDLADAIAAIPGLGGSEPTDVLLDPNTTAKHVVLTIPEEPPCRAGEGGYSLWHNVGEGASSSLRLASEPGSTIQVWIFRQEDRWRFPRILVDAETYKGASAELHEEIWQIVDSIRYYGG
jgi:hypothetical protein